MLVRGPASRASPTPMLWRSLGNFISKEVLIGQNNDNIFEVSCSQRISRLHPALPAQLFPLGFWNNHPVRLLHQIQPERPPLHPVLMFQTSVSGLPPGASYFCIHHPINFFATAWSVGAETILFLTGSIYNRQPLSYFFEYVYVFLMPSSSLSTHPI